MRSLRTLFALFVILPGIALAQGPTPDILTAEEVLASSERHFPRILQAMAARRQAEGETLTAAGAFDLVFDADGFSRLTGFYDGTAVEGIAKQRIRPLGASLYAGYKISDGDFPIYEDVNFTNTGGAVKVGMLFSLLRDRTIDQQRFTETDARLKLRSAEIDVLFTKVGVQERALVAYWRWVMAGRTLQIFENLLAISLDREKALERQVSQGARAEIFLTENRQNINRRQRLVASAQRDAQIAANALSLFYRDDEGQPATPSDDQVPAQMPIEDVARIAEPPPLQTSEVLERRPELEQLRIAIDRERNRLRLAENDLKPRVDLNVEVQEGLGSIAEGGPSRDTTDTIVGFTFSVPLQRRSARGRIDSSQAAISAREFEQRLRTEQIELEIRNLLVDLTVSQQLLLIAENELRNAELMRRSEVRRFQSGASEFFLLNSREETEADARIGLLAAELATRIARANYDAATVDLRRLGISDTP